MTQTDKKYWFKRRRYGWGWTPVTWQGWTSILVLVGLPIATAVFLQPYVQQPLVVELAYIVLIIDLTFLIALSRAKGPEPRWRWGKKAGDNPDEDI